MLKDSNPLYMPSQMTILKQSERIISAWHGGMLGMLG